MLYNGILIVVYFFLILASHDGNVIDPPGIRLKYDSDTKILKLEAYWKGKNCSSTIASKIIDLDNFQLKEDAWKLEEHEINQTKIQIQSDSSDLNEYNAVLGKVVFKYLVKMLPTPYTTCS